MEKLKGKLKKLPKELRTELTELLGAMKKSLKEPKVYDPKPENTLTARLNELESRGYDIEKYKKKYEKLRYSREQLEEKWREEI